MRDFNISGGQQTFFFWDQESGKPDAYQTVRLSKEDKAWLKDIASTSVDSKNGASTVARDAIRFYREFYQVRHKLCKYRHAVVSMVGNLP